VDVQSVHRVAPDLPAATNRGRPRGCEASARLVEIVSVFASTRKRTCSMFAPSFWFSALLLLVIVPSALVASYLPTSPR
jgi:hypothetical protein